MSTSTPEYNTDDNAVVITDPLLTITTAPPRFVDVPFDYWAWAYIEAIADAGITNGCATDRFCPSDLVPRDQMAAFIVRALEGEPAADYCGTEAPFLDVPADYWACKYIKRLAELGITIGCDLSGDLYCPSSLVPRDQMAVFLVRAIEGDPAPGYCAGVSPFDDVPSRLLGVRAYQAPVRTGGDKRLWRRRLLPVGHCSARSDGDLLGACLPWSELAADGSRKGEYGRGMVLRL